MGLARFGDGAPARCGVMTFLIWLEQWIVMTDFETCNLETVKLLCETLKATPYKWELLWQCNVA